MNDKVVIEIINGVEGQCVAINDYRVAGPKPWGGGTVSKKFASDMSNMRRALKIEESAQTDKQPLKVAIAQVKLLEKLFEYKTWRTLFDFFKQTKLKYRRSLDLMNLKEFSLNNRKSLVILYSY